MRSKKVVIIGVPKERLLGERRVALVPSSLPNFIETGVEVLVEKGSGISAGFDDDSYRSNGAQIVHQRPKLFDSSDLLVFLNGPSADNSNGRADLDMLRCGHALVGFMNPLTDPDQMKVTSVKGVTVFAMELMPRIAKAQGMDALSSMATISGYKSVLLAAEALSRMFPMLMTAAGTVLPAKVLVLGVGVAGLQAIATARRLGAVVRAYDIRPAVKEQVESLGAKFLQLPLELDHTEVTDGYAKGMGEEFYDRQRQFMKTAVVESDVVISTAAVPGKDAPVLITYEMVSNMRPGSVIVDLAAEAGGNCEMTRPGETTVEKGVTVIGTLNLPSTIPHDASQMFSKNLVRFLGEIIKGGNIQIDLEEEVVRETLVTYCGEVVHPRIRELLGMSAKIGNETAVSGEGF